MVRKISVNQIIFPSNYVLQAGEKKKEELEEFHGIKPKLKYLLSSFCQENFEDVKNGSLPLL